MKIRCVKNNLEKVLQGAENFLGKNLDLEVLSCVLLEAKDGLLKIESTNINTSFNSEIPVLLEKEGRVAIAGDIFYKTISALNDNEVVLEVKNNILEVKSKNSIIQINTIAFDDFPTSLRIEDQDNNNLEKKITFSTKDFVEGLNSTFYAASKSNIKPELSSVFIKGDGNKLFFVATDGYRLAEKNFVYKSDSNEEFSVLLPGESIPAIIKTLSVSENNELEIFFFKNQIFIKNKDFVIFSRLVEGDYVDYKKLIPEDTNTSVIILKQDFLDSLKLINIFSDEFHQIKIIIENKKIKIENKNNIGKNERFVEAVVAGEDIEANFNYKYIQDAFSSIKTDSFEFIFNPTKPLLIVPVGDKSFRYIIMPLSK